MKQMITIATCQFPVSADIKKNASYIIKQLTYAKAKGADIAHFSESSLSGYASIDFPSLEGRDNELLHSSLENIKRKCRKLEIWALVGSHYYEGKNRKPFNCLWLINDIGKAVIRYDKRFCMGKPGQFEQKFYKPGQTPGVFQIRNIKCGLLICHEWRYPELYREYKSLGCDIIFHSWYDGNLSDKNYLKEGKELGTLIVGSVRGYAANNYLWISASNTSKRESSFAGFVTCPDGSILHKFKRNISGVLISKIDLNRKFVDPSAAWRGRAIRGMLHSA
jgi:predicted amidohydrolase